jgi:formamidopyrimidine-DNA glycosylase
VYGRWVACVEARCYEPVVPELPDLEAYVEALHERVAGVPLVAIELASPFVLRTVDPPPRELEGKRVESVRRMGKRVVVGLEGELALALHLMIAGRLHWIEPGGRMRGRHGTALASFRFASGTLTLTEAGSQRRASLHLLRGRDAVAALRRGGIEPLEADLETFARALTAGNHTLKRALTDPDLFSGIGNAYSDEILHAARLSPVQLTSRLDRQEIERLHEAMRRILGTWAGRLRAERAGGFPEGVTAFRESFAVHGRHRQPCPDCGAPVQRIVHGDRETNYCARCQTEGRILSDRSLARLLKRDWPRTVDELEGRPGFAIRAAPSRKGR